MDPDANLKEQIELAERMVERYDVIDDPDANRLAELVLALDEWIKKGGFLPQKWRR